MAENDSNAARTLALVDKPEWLRRCAYSEKGLLLASLDNLVAILANDTRWAGVIAYDEFSGQVMKLQVPPYDNAEAGEWTDLDDVRLEYWLASNYGLRGIRGDTLMKGVLLTADAHRFHAVRDYLQGLTWDGTPRLRDMLNAWFGAGKTDYNAAVSLKWMVGAVARVMRPGCKMDNVMILEGEQGILKSTALKVLFDPWFTDAAFEIGSTDGYQIMRGMWCVELAELDGFNRAEASKSKGFFSRMRDRYRNPYGRKPVDVPRQGVFAGSVNHGTYLKDDTGNRRYWPVKVGGLSIDELRNDRDQLWAEALHEYNQGTEWWARASDKSMFEEQQEERYQGDAWETRIKQWLAAPPNEGGVLVDAVTLADVLRGALALDPSKWSQPEQQRAGRIMARIGWTRIRQKRGRREWFYVRPGSEAQVREEMDRL